MSVLKTITYYFKHHKFKAFLIIFMICLVTVLALLPAQVLRIIVDDAIGNKKSKQLLTFAIVYGICYLVIGITTFIKDIIMLRTSQDITCDLKCNMMKHVHKLNYKSLVNTDSGTLEAYFNNDVNSINDLFTSGVVNMATDLFKMIGIVITIFIYSVTFGFIVLALLPGLVLFTAFIRKKMMAAQLRTKKEESNVNKILLENVENIEQVKINKAYDYANSKYNVILRNHFKMQQASNLYDALFSPVMQVVRNIVIVGILLISGYNANIFGMTVGMIISAISLISDLFTPIEVLGMEIQTIQKSMASIKRIDGLFKLETDQDKFDYNVTDFEIDYKDVSFAYDEKEVISNFNLSIKPGEKVAFQGPSGAGKSTLMKLAMGLLTPTSGQVDIGGYEASKLSDNTKKHLFSIVYQDPFFSDGSIYDEISLLDTSITKEMVRKSLDTVGLDYLTDLDKKFDSTNYSSGELALLNIARVVVRDTKIVFLDEMNSKIDPITAKAIMEVINKITKDKIVISINHYGNVLDNAVIINV